MDMIDRYAHSNAIRCVDPAQKGALALMAMGLCLLLDRLPVGLLTLGWMLALTVLWARVPAPVFGRVVLAQGLFLAVATLGVMLSAGIGRPIPGLWALRAGPLWLGTSPEAVAAALQLLARALGCASALTFLILTTPLVDLIDLLRRLRAPEALVDLMTLTYRSIFVLLESYQRMRLARGTGPGDAGPRHAMGSAALLASQLLLDAYRRSLRLQVGLESHGMDGALRVPPMTYTRNRSMWRLGAAIAASLLLAGIAQ